MYKTTSEELAERGKAEEARVQTYLKDLQDKNFSFTFMRLPDARSSRGRGAVKRVSDFIFQVPGHHCCLEVKAVNHPHLLPHKNLSQLPMMKRYTGSGHEICVMVYHVVSSKAKENYWTVPDFDWLYAHRHDPSWDLSVFNKHQKHQGALKEFFLLNNIQF